MATQTISITKQALPQTITIPLRVVNSTPTTKVFQQTTTTFQCVCPARDTPVCRHHQNIISTTTTTSGDDQETNNTGFYLRREGQPQRHMDWENLIEENNWTRCTQWAESTFYSPEKQQNTKTIHTVTITGLCDFCLTGHRGLYSSDISRVEDQLSDKEDSYTRGSSRSSSRTRKTEEDDAFEMVDYGMGDSMLRLHTTTQTPSPLSFTLGLGLKTIPPFTNTLYGIVKGSSKAKNKNKNFNRRPSSSYSISSYDTDTDMEEEPDLDIVNNFEEEIGLLELDDKTEGNHNPLDLEPEVWINHP